jgi:urease accessory protein
MMVEDSTAVRAHGPLPSSASCGTGRITVSVVADQSSATSVEARAPLKILVPRPRGQSVWAYLSNFGGGLLPGDEINVAIDVQENARCFIGTQSSTKIFRDGPKGAVQNHIAASVDSGGLLVYAPDVAQGFANSRYRQTQRFDLADASANLVFLDWYSAGRAARGERWAFAEYTSRTEIRVADELAVLESISLDAADETIDLPSRMGRVHCVATLVVVGNMLRPHASALVEQTAALPISKRADAVVVASSIRCGAIVRVAATSVEAAAGGIFPRLEFVAALLGDNPFVRKW